MAKQQVKKWPALDVFAAAVAAYRVNGGQYVSAAPPHGDQSDSKTPNVKLLREILVDGPAPTGHDIEGAEEILSYYRGYSLRILAELQLSKFDMRALHLASSPDVKDSELAIVACLPSSIEGAKKADEVRERISSATSGWIGKSGDYLELDIEVVKSFWSHNWSTWYVTALTACNHCVFFSSKKAWKTGTKATVVGKVKSHLPDYQTRLNYVKIKSSEFDK